MRNVYHLEGVTDLAVTREQSLARTKPNNPWGREPEQTIIHKHATQDPCVGSGHDFFGMTDLEINDWTFTEVQKNWEKDNGKA